MSSNPLANIPKVVWFIAALSVLAMIDAIVFPDLNDELRKLVLSVDSKAEARALGVIIILDSVIMISEVLGMIAILYPDRIRVNR